MAVELEDVEAYIDITDGLIHSVNRQALWDEGSIHYVQALDILLHSLGALHPEVMSRAFCKIVGGSFRIPVVNVSSLA